MISQEQTSLEFRHTDCHNGDTALTMQTPGQRIRSAREDAGYNQGEFAKLLSISQGTLSEIESGESKLPSSPVLIKMCELLNKPPRWILYGESGDLNWPTPEEIALLESFRTMNESEKAALIATAAALANKRS